jgi:hypothetical protein
MMPDPNKHGHIQGGHRSEKRPTDQARDPLLNITLSAGMTTSEKP